MAALVAGVAEAGTTLTGKVTHIRDGDTIEVGGVPVRLNGLSAPEMNEPGGKVARDAMVVLVAGKTVHCELDGTRTYDRFVGICYLDGADIAMPLVEAGVARDCPRFSKGRYRQYETDAGRSLQLPKYCR